MGTALLLALPVAVPSSTLQLASALQTAPAYTRTLALMKTLLVVSTIVLIQGTTSHSTIFCPFLIQCATSAVMLGLLQMHPAAVACLCVMYFNHVDNLALAISTLLNLVDTCVHAVQDTRG